MNTLPTKLSGIQLLERKYSQEKDFRQRLVLLDQLVNYYVFTNVQRAQSLLSELKTALNFHPNQDVQLNYLVNNALVENQLYNYLLSEIHLSKALVILDEIGTAGQQIDAFIDYAGILINLKRHEEALDYLDKASMMLASFPDERLEARRICRAAYLELHFGKHDKAINLLLQAEQKINGLSISLELKDHYFLTLIYSGLGNIYKEVREGEKCVEAYLKVLEICNSLGMKTRLSWHYLNVGNAYMILNEMEAAKVYLEKAIKIPDDISLLARAGASANLGRYYFLKGNYTEALNLYKRAEKLYQKEDNIYNNLFLIERWRAELFRTIQKEKKAQKHLIKAFNYAKLTDDASNMSNILEDIADYYRVIGEFENAYNYQKLHTKWAIQYFEESNARKVFEMQIKYEAEKRKQQAELLELEATQLQLKALRAQMNPHFMHNALNSIQRYIMSNDADAAAHFLARFARLMRQSLEYSDMESIPLEKEIEFLEDYLLINQKLRFGALEYKITIDEDIEEDIMGVPTMIIQPYVENAIEHGLRTKKENALLHVQFSLLDEDTILCIVEDNGIGRVGAQKLQELEREFSNHKSMGTSITERRLQLIQNTHNFSNLSVETTDALNEQGNVAGTKVFIRIPIVGTTVK